MVWHVPVPLPSAINHDEFMNIIFWDGERNIRWRRGTEIKVYFDYEGAPNMAPADRLAAEAQALREMQAWLDPPGALGPYLRWGGQVHDPDLANVIVYMLHDDAWLERWPDDIDLRVAGRGGPQRFDPDGLYRARAHLGSCGLLQVSTRFVRARVRPCVRAQPPRGSARRPVHHGL